MNKLTVIAKMLTSSRALFSASAVPQERTPFSVPGHVIFSFIPLG
jgi:hypothetical protein